MILLFKLFLSALCIVVVNSNRNNVMDWDLYEEVIDLEQCGEQLAYIQNHTLLMSRFIDASFRFPPRSILKGNTRDTGSYFQCLDISHQTADMDIRGKYSVVQIPLQQDDFEFPTLPDIPEWPELPPLPNITWPIIPNPNSTEEESGESTEELFAKFHDYQMMRYGAHFLLGDGIEPRAAADSPLAGMQMELAMCIPKVCTSKYALDFVTNNATSNLTMTEAFVRLPNDKPWVAADYVAIVIFSIIGFLTVLSTGYDVRHTILLEKDPKRANKICTLFSVYTNTKNFFVFASNPNAITCLDGIRSFAMMWVIVGHTFVTQVTYIPENPLDILEFMKSFWGLWITSATITVDTFFMISGLLIVYTTAAKVSRRSLIRKIHLFYLNRILRMFPILAAMVLIEASFLHRTTDGPYWNVMTTNVNDCRTNWWSTLLFIQNWVNPLNQCLYHTWYLAVDMQLHIASPIILFWILGQRSFSAWCAMVASLVAAIVGATTYNFINNFQSAVIPLGRPAADLPVYLSSYYFHTLNRISPFIIGMMVGYVLHLYRGKTVRMPKALAGFLWLVAAAVSFMIIFTTYFNIQPDWDNQLADNIINSSIRPAWAVCIGWLVFACKSGYAGPINWVLSLHIFKILGRLSYAMYIVHFPLIFLMNATTLHPIYFAVNYSMYKFFVDFTLTVIAAFCLTIFIDAPLTSIIKIFLGGGSRPPLKVVPPSAPKDPELAFKAVDVVDNCLPNDYMAKTRM
ncbi:O-acyltransferase like protein-like [Ostrinia nubilalis]|uniref:O-acyltransferase like protein-like n=1 Tax=Ostrinia nubilalis TaxID=29057 RepID=UPI0030824247